LPRSIADSDARPGLQVLERTFGILEVFTQARPEWSATEVAREIDLPVPTVHRILAALKGLGYVSQHQQTRRFRLGLAALSLGERARALADLRPVALGPLRELSEQTGETALLTVLSPARDRSVCLERVETSQPLRLSVEPGRQLPLHAGASQKALLAFMPGDEIDAIAARPLERCCSATITSRRALMADLAAIRARGWASSFEETNVGVWGIAVPVLSAADVICAVGIAGPSPRLSAERVRPDVRLTHEAAVSIGRALGLSSPPVAATEARIWPATGPGHVHERSPV
jgi:DNA-binding IclR family transcriptional regulator